jgi:hypothetical protein
MMSGAPTLSTSNVYRFRGRSAWADRPIYYFRKDSEARC